MIQREIQNQVRFRSAVPGIAIGYLACFIACFLTFGMSPEFMLAQSPLQLTGVKVGEVTSDSAIIWTRLTAQPSFADDWPKINGAKIPGVQGEIQIQFRPGQLPSDESDFQWQSTEWQAVIQEADFSRQVKLVGLRAATRYEFRVNSRQGDMRGSEMIGSFKTAPGATEFARVDFTVVTGQGYHRRDDGVNGHRIFKSMRSYPTTSGNTVATEPASPDFLVHTGDIVYYDRDNPVATTVGLARHHWHRMFAMPNQLDFHRLTASYFMKDDHDTLFNDCWPGFKNPKTGEFTFQDGVALFREQAPMSELPYRTFRWGKDLQIWLVEGRDFRSPNRMPDGPEKTIWGKKQIDWFTSTIEQSSASFKLLISPTPIVGPDRKNKNDNHANAGFKTEGDWLRSYLKENDVVVICGDRHWQYVSTDSDTGLMEFSCGPTSDAHAGGFKENDRSDMHQFLRVKGGFLSATVDRTNEKPTLTIRHHDVHGEVVHSYTIERE